MSQFFHLRRPGRPNPVQTSQKRPWWLPVASPGGWEHHAIPSRGQIVASAKDRLSFGVPGVALTVLAKTGVVF